MICWVKGEVGAGSRDLRSSGVHRGNRPIRRRDEGGALAASGVLGVDRQSWRRSAHHRYRNKHKGVIPVTTTPAARCDWSAVFRCSTSLFECNTYCLPVSGKTLSLRIINLCSLSVSDKPSHSWICLSNLPLWIRFHRLLYFTRSWTLSFRRGRHLLYAPFFLSGLQVNEDRWRGETVLQSTFSSKLLNLGQIAASASPPGTTDPSLRPISSLHR